MPVVELWIIEVLANHLDIVPIDMHFIAGLFLEELNLLVQLPQVDNLEIVDDIQTWKVGSVTLVHSTTLPVRSVPGSQPHCYSHIILK